MGKARLTPRRYTGGPALPRKAIKLNNRTDLIVEVRLLTIKFSHKDHGEISKTFSKGKNYEVKKTNKKTEFLCKTCNPEL
jgi:hypothetical protein